MKIVISSLLLTATAVAYATNCDVNVLSAISDTSDAKECKQVSNFVVPVDTTVDTILTDLEAFCSNKACKRVLEALQEVDACSIDGSDLLQTVVNPIDAVCSTTRALRAADGSHVHSSGMDMGSTSGMEDSHDVASASTASSEAEDSHDTPSAASGAEDSHDATSSTYESTSAGEDDDHDSHDTASSTASSTAGTAGSTATSSNSTASTQAPSASSAASITVAAGSVFLAAAAATFL
ncbi:hypothetical protein V7S43_002179 [Phytophthora oleae]|uniref:Elicitin n=1 Tax=Phytophthora oleae TaxID=2107226 RepID=A0ABD3G3T7_9STRA